MSSSKRTRPHLDFESSRIVFWSNYRYANVRSLYLCALIMVHATGTFASVELKLVKQAFRVKDSAPARIRQTPIEDAHSVRSVISVRRLDSQTSQKCFPVFLCRPWHSIANEARWLLAVAGRAQQSCTTGSPTFMHSCQSSGIRGKFLTDIYNFRALS